MNEYVIGLVLQRCELDDGQLAEIKSRIAHIRLTWPQARIVLKVPGMELRYPERLPHVATKVLPYAVNGVEPIGKYWPRLWRDPIAFLFSELRVCDEVWCCTTQGQHFGSRARPSALWRYAQNQGMPRAPRFKLIVRGNEPEPMPSKSIKKGAMQ